MADSGLAAAIAHAKASAATLKSEGSAADTKESRLSLSQFLICFQVGGAPREGQVYPVAPTPQASQNEVSGGDSQGLPGVSRVLSKTSGRVKKVQGGGSRINTPRGRVLKNHENSRRGSETIGKPNNTILRPFSEGPLVMKVS